MDFDTCDRCGKKADVQRIGEEDICEECLDAYFQQCDICREYWDTAYIDFIVTENDQMVCQFCAEDMEDED